MGSRHAIKIIAISLLWVTIFFVWWMPRAPHATSWHRDVVIKTKDTRRLGAAEGDALRPPPLPQSVLLPPKNPFALQQGVDYFSDYDIANVTAPKDPPLAPGQKYLFNYMDEATSKWRFKWVSNQPKVAYVPNFLTHEECDSLVATATPQLARSMVSAYKTGANNVDDVRTSSQMWLDVNSGVAAPIADRIYSLIGFPKGSSEMLQILKYEVGQKYDAHNDYFDPKLYGPQSTNRAVTVYLYLSDVEEGGHTWFPNADGKALEFQDYKSCKRGFGMKPKKGSAVVFYDMQPNGEYDPSSLHGSCPVKKGVKWGGTLWFRVKT